MKTRGIAMVLALALCSNVLATYMGPSITTMKQGQWALGVRGAWSESDLEIEGLGDEENVELTSVLGSVHVGLATSRMELFGLFGMGDVEDADAEFAGGLGTKITMNGGTPLSWGLLAQAVFYEGDEPFLGDVELEAWEIRIAGGPVWRFDNLCLYGGPFLRLIDGDVDTGTTSLDVEEDNLWGGYVGVGLTFDCVEVTGEAQIGPDIWGVGLGATFKL